MVLSGSTAASAIALAEEAAVGAGVSCVCFTGAAVGSSIADGIAALSPCGAPGGAGTGAAVGSAGLGGRDYDIRKLRRTEQNELIVQILQHVRPHAVIPPTAGRGFPSCMNT